MADKIMYFLCTGNSARSQIAEGLAKKYLSDEYEIHSSGVEVTPVNPYAVKAMDEIGIDIMGQTSKLIDMKILPDLKAVMKRKWKSSEKPAMN